MILSKMFNIVSVASVLQFRWAAFDCWFVRGVPGCGWCSVVVGAILGPVVGAGVGRVAVGSVGVSLLQIEKNI